MKPFRVTSAALICASLLTLTACGGEDTATTAGSAPSATAAPASAAASSAPSSSAAAGTTGGTSDKKLCESAKKAGEDMKAKLIAAMRSGEVPSTAEFKKILIDLGEELTTLASAGGDSKVATAMKQIGAEASKAAATADPATAANNAAFEKAGTDLATACKAAGVNVNF